MPFLYPLPKMPKDHPTVPPIPFSVLSPPPYIFALWDGNHHQSMLCVCFNDELHPQAPASLVFCNANSRKIPGQDGPESNPMQLLFRETLPLAGD